MRYCDVLVVLGLSIIMEIVEELAVKVEYLESTYLSERVKVNNSLAYLFKMRFTSKMRRKMSNPSQMIMMIEDSFKKSNAMQCRRLVVRVEHIKHIHFDWSLTS